MQLKSLALAAGLMAGIASSAHAQVEIQWWHSMTGALGDRVTEIANGFNASQHQYKVVPVFKGTYPESMTAAIAAYRAGDPPAIVQVFEVGTATMMSAKGAIKPVYQLMKESGLPFNPRAYLPAVAGYYTDRQGHMLSMPFNASTPVFYINEDAFRKAGLPPVAPKTWKEFAVTAGKLKASGQSCVYTTGWPAWVQVENFSAWHNLPIGTLENGIGGVKTELKINAPAQVAQIQMLADFAKNGWFTYAGRKSEGEAKFYSGECAMMTSSSAALANIRQNAKFKFSVHFLPYNDAIPGAPQNTIIGGASLWVMGKKSPAEYKGVAQFFNYLSNTDLQVNWHEKTGYVPITLAAYEAARKSGYYDKNPGADIAIRELDNKPPTANSKGLRFGNYVQGRDIIEEEMEAVFAGKKTAQAGMDEAVQRVDEQLRRFEATAKE